MAPVVDADQRQLEKRRSFKIVQDPYFDDDVPVPLPSGSLQLGGLHVGNSLHDDQNAVGVERPRLRDLIGSRINSLRRTGSWHAELASVRSLPVPWKEIVAVTTERQGAPPSAYARAGAAGSKPGRIKRDDGVAFLISAVSPSKAPEVFCQGFGDSLIDFVLRWWTRRTPVEELRSRDEVVRAVKRALDGADIDIDTALPQHTLSFLKPDVVQH